VQRVRHLQSLGLSLDRIKGVLGEPLAYRAGEKDVGDARGLRMARGVRKCAGIPGALLYAENLEEYRAALALEERLVHLSDLPEDSQRPML
jgi:hypothetical protein